MTELWKAMKERRKRNKLNIQDIFFVLFAWTISILVILIYYSHYGIDSEKYMYAIVYSFFSSITMIYVFSCISFHFENKTISLGAILLLLIVLYNQNALTKFIVDRLFYGYISNDFQRILGSVFIDILIVICASRYKRNMKNEDYSVGFDDLFVRKKPNTFIIYCMILAYILIKIYELQYGIRYNRTQYTLINSIMYTVYFLISLNIYLQKNNPIIAYLPLIIVSIIQMITSIHTGGKSPLVIFVLIVTLELLILDRVKLNTLKIAFCLSPVLLQTVTILTESTSGRMRLFSKEFIMEYHAFRYDLSDFAISIALKYHPSDYIPQMIKESFIFSIPGYSIDVKNYISRYGAYVQQLESMGFPRYDYYGSLSDFNDTIFSIGAQIGGFIGIPLMFIGLIVFLDWISRILCKNRFGKILIMIMIGPCALVECDLKMLIFRIRDLGVIFLISYLLIKMIYRDEWGIRFKNRIFH